MKRCNQALLGYEEKLHLVERFMSIRDKVKEMNRLLDGYEEKSMTELVESIRRISDEIIEEL